MTLRQLCPRTVCHRFARLARSRSITVTALTVFTLVGVCSWVVAARAQPRPTGAADPPARVDYLTFAHGAVPVAIGGAGAKLGATFEHAVRIIDGDPTAFTVVSRATADTDTEFVYELPALTTFDRFAVPGISETPSPTDTFTKHVEIHGSASSATEGFVLLASATLETHKARGMVTELPIVATLPVRWIRLRLVGGINVMRPQSNFEFSEIVGNGAQEPAAPVDHFTGAWRTMGLRLQLRQQGVLVSGCYDRTGQLSGSVTGNILRATGINPSDNTRSGFILSVAADGSVRGVRSSNGAPFRLYTLAAAPGDASLDCEQRTPSLGCGSVIHGITFAFDSAEIRPESEAVLAELHKGLSADTHATVVIEGHTSSEGADDYNQRLSERRAQAVVADLVRRGVAKARLTAAGIGEARPIAPNTDESGRSLNRRVEVICR